MNLKILFLVLIVNHRLLTTASRGYRFGVQLDYNKYHGRGQGRHRGGRATCFWQFVQPDYIL